MKFKIRYADQIVGILAILAIAALFLVIILLGSRQRWFSRDYHFTTVFDTASGINTGMAVQYKGFTVGKIISYTLDENDRVIVRFSLFDTYYNRARTGSVVEFITNPIGLGNQFLFHPGAGSGLIEDGSLIPRLDTPEGRELVEKGLVLIPKRDDTVANIMAQVNPILSNLKSTLEQVNGAFSGTGRGPLADTMRGTASTLTHVSSITGDVSASMSELMVKLDSILRDVQGITTNLESMSNAFADPSGLVPKLVDPDGTMFDSIEASLKAVEGTLGNVEDSSSILKSQVPQIARLIEDLRIALLKGQDVLDALRNNPILRGGVQERIQTQDSGTNSRAIEF